MSRAQRDGNGHHTNPKRQRGFRGGPCPSAGAPSLTLRVSMARGPPEREPLKTNSPLVIIIQTSRKRLQRGNVR